MEQPLVSIILPTYNVEKYLEKCLNSIASQTYKNIEVIIIIDGAKDKSYDISKEFCASHPKFNVFWQENQGSGPARNNGLDRARGEFIMFVDPDDWLESDCLEQLMGAQIENDYDLTISQKIECFFDNQDNLLRKQIATSYSFEYTDAKSCHENYLRLFDLGLLGAPTRKIYKTAIIKNNDIRFPNYRRSQDIVFNYRYYNCIQSVRSIKYNGYNYRMPLIGTGGKFRREYYRTIAAIYQDIKNLHKEWVVYLDEGALATHLFNANLYAYLQLAANSNSDISESLEDPVISEIIKKASPKRIHQKVLQSLLENDMKKTARTYLKVLCSIKTKMGR